VWREGEQEWGGGGCLLGHPGLATNSELQDEDHSGTHQHDSTNETDRTSVSAVATFLPSSETRQDGGGDRRPCHGTDPIDAKGDSDQDGQRARSKLLSQDRSQQGDETTAQQSVKDHKHQQDRERRGKHPDQERRQGTGQYTDQTQVH